jgi:O-antigen/teichoic acid export membrane protein
MFAAAPWGAPLALGRDYVAAVPVVQWLSPLPFIIGLSNVLGINIMLPFGMKTEFATIVVASAVINFLAMIALCPLFGAVGAAASALATECFVTGTMAYVLYSRRSRPPKSEPMANCERPA